MSDNPKTLADQMIADAEAIIAGDRAEIQAIADRFFTQPPTDVAGSPVVAVPEVSRKKRKSRKWDPTLLALKHFAEALEKDPSESSRRAAIYWLLDKYCGVKLWAQE